MNATILCYHKVGPESMEGRRLNISPERLESHLRYVLRRGSKVVAARDVQPGTVCFTFDDAYRSTLENAIPIFRRNQCAATFYAVTELVGQSSIWDGQQSRPLADWETLREAQRLGHEIGNHTASHPHLNQVSREEAERQILEADAQLRAEGIQPSSFCYPYGHFLREHRTLIGLCGYRLGLTLKKPRRTETFDLLELPRTVIAFSDTIPMLIYKTVIRPRWRR